MLATSCGKDIDDNCRGVNFDAAAEGMPSRNQDVVSAKCQADYPRRLRGASSSACPRAAPF